MSNTNQKTMLKGKPHAKNAKGTAARLLGYIAKNYKLKFSLVCLCILITAATSVASSLFIKTVISDFIEPMLASGSTDFLPLIKAIAWMAAIFAVGVIATYLYNLFMVYISQGILKDIRDEMFVKMQKFPIKYFDTNTYGDIMSRYTNDTDIMESMWTHSLPQLIQSLSTIFIVLIFVR